MKITLRNVFLGALLLNAFLSGAPDAIARKYGTPAILVQSVPEKTDLGQPGMPYARETWIDMIDHAKETIDIEQMYVSGDKGKSPATNSVLRALEAASSRGVKIRLILAQQMIDMDPIMLGRLKNIPTLELAVVDYGKLTGGIQHAKFWIIDNRELFLGSQNLDYLALTQIHEVGVRIQDEILVQRLRSVFDLDWTMAKTGKIPADLGTAPPTPRNADIEMVASPAGLNPKNVESAITALKRLLTRAKRSVEIQVMEYSTFSDGAIWKELDDAIRAAARRGVKVKMLVSHWNTGKPAIESIKKLSLEKNVELRICTVPDLPSGHIPYSRVIHSKYMIVDNQVLWVGSSNWSKGYFKATRGIEMIMYRPDLAETAAKMFETVWTAPYTVPVDVNRNYPKPVK